MFSSLSQDIVCIHIHGLPLCAYGPKRETNCTQGRTVSVVRESHVSPDDAGTKGLRDS